MGLEKLASFLSMKDKKKIKIQKPSEQKEAERKATADEVKKYVRQIPHAAEPNLGRVYEIKEEIKKGTYLTQEKLDATASILAARLTRPHSGHQD